MRHILAKLNTKRLLTLIAAFVVTVSSLSALAPILFSRTANALSTTTFSQGFESNTDGWLPYNNLVSRTAGSGSISAATGSYYATVSDGAFTQWGGYSSTFPAQGYATSVDFYLDSSLATGTVKQFAYTSAINNQSGNHLRDFVFSIGTTTTSGVWAVSASNNAPGDPSANGHLEISTSGWYTFKHEFKNVGGALTVNMSVLNSSGTVLKTWTLSNPADLIGTVVGGNRYGWVWNYETDAVPSVLMDNSKMVVETPDAPSAPLDAAFYQGATVVPTGKTLNGHDTINNIEFKWNTVGEATDAYVTRITYPNGTENTVWTSTKNVWIGQTQYVNNYFGQKGEGTYTYSVQARSAVTGLWSAWTAPISLIYDTNSPVASFTVTPPTYVNGNLHVSGVASDSVSLSGVFFDVRDPSDTTGNAWRAGCVAGTTNLVYTNNQKNATIECDINTASLVDGKTYTLRIHAGDNAGYGGGEDRTIIIDRILPRVTVTTPQSNELTDGSFTISGTASDNNGVNRVLITIGRRTPGNVFAGYVIQNVPAAWDGTNFSYDVNLPDFDGTYYVRAIAYDNAENSKMAGVDGVKVDSTRPQAPTTTSPKPYYTNASSTTKTLTWNPSSSSDVAYYEYAEWYNTAPADQTTPYDWLKTPISGTSTTDTAWGSNITIFWRVRAVDFAGNKSDWSDIGQIITDVDTPFVTVNTLNTTNIAPTLTGTVNDPDATVLVTVNGNTYTADNNGDGTWTVNVSDALALGTYNVIAAATDLAGNTGTDSTTAELTVSAVSVPLVTPPEVQLLLGPTAAQFFANATPQNSGNDQGTNTGDEAVAGAQTQKDNTKDNDQAVEGASDSKGPLSLWGLAWFWWLVILAALAAIGWWLIAGYRRNSEEA